MKIIKPVDLNLESMIVDNKKYMWYKNSQGKIGLLPEVYLGKNLRKYIPAFYYFINLIIMNSYNDKMKCWLEQYKDYTKINSYQLDEVSISYIKRRQIIAFLVGLKIITVKGVDQDIKTNKGTFRKNIRYYKINEPYNGQNEIYDIKLNYKKVAKSESTTLANKGITFNKPFLQDQYVKQKQVNFNSIEAKKHVDSLYKEKSISNIQYISYCNSIDRIESKRFYFIVAPNCDRVYTSINGLSKELRGYIQDNDNNALIELDYSNTNVFLLYKIFTEFSKGLKADSINENNVNFKIEFEKYKMYLDRDFYQSIAEILGTDRETTKDTVLRNWINFNSNGDYVSDSYAKMFEIFPTLSKRIKAMKAKGGKTRENYLKFYNDIMKLESKLVNEIVYSRVMIEYPECIIYTIFDSLLIKSRYLDQVRDIMIEEGLKFTGYNVKVKIK